MFLYRLARRPVRGGVFICSATGGDWRRISKKGMGEANR